MGVGATCGALGATELLRITLEGGNHGLGKAEEWVEK